MNRKLRAIVAASMALTVSSASVHASDDPGTALYQDMHAAGATMYSDWARTADADHGTICAEYDAGYADETDSMVGEYRETKTMIISAIQATGFCS